MKSMARPEWLRDDLNGLVFASRVTIVNRRFLIEDSAVDKLGEGRAPPGVKCQIHPTMT